MTRTLETVDASDIPRLWGALRLALDGEGPAVVPRDPHRTPAPDEPALPATVARNVALVVETSGSSGPPKRVALSADALLASAAASAGALRGEGEWLLALPAHYIAGVQVLVRSIAAGTRPALLAPGHFDPLAFARTVGQMGGPARFVSLVPVQLARLLDAAEEDPRVAEALRGLDRVLVGGQSTPRSLHERALAGGVRVVRTYGASETAGGCVYDGVPIGAASARTVDGRLELAGPMLAEGYLGDPERTAATFHEDGVRWYRTGDLGALELGRVVVHGRADNVIVSGGEKVSLDAVERRVRELPGLEAAVVVGADDPQWGRVPVVVVERAETAPREAELGALRSHVASALGRAAAPARVLAVPSLPTLSSGKPDRRAIEAAASTG